MAQSRPQFQCGYFGCNKTFTRRTGARRHETTVHGDKKYCCSEPDCNYRGGKRRHDFKKHMQNKHPGYDDHLFVPEDFSNLQGSHSLVADRSRSPEVGHSSQISGDFSPMPPSPSTRSSSSYIPVGAHEVPSTPSMVPLASAGVLQSHDNTISSTIISLRPPDTCEFQDVHLPRSEFEPVPTTTTAIGSIWTQVDPSTMCDLGGLQDMTGICIENKYATFEGGYDLSRYGQPGNDPYHRW